MMMEALEAGGLEVIKSDRRDIVNNRNSDQYYKPNPNSLYELTTKRMLQPGFPKQYNGKVLKILANQVCLLSVYEYSVVFMKRNSEEIRQSYEAAFSEKISIERIEQAVENAIAHFKNRRDINNLFIWNYREVIENPLEHFQKLDWPINAEKSANIVDPKKLRFKLENLEVGI